MEPITEQIAGISLFSVLVILTVLTAARCAFSASRFRLVRGLAELLESVILAVVLVFLLLRPFVVQSYFIPSASMHPTLWEGDHILVNKCIYRMHKPERGDVIVFRAPRDASPDEKEFIKRLIGVPGDVVQVEAAYVTVGLTTYTGDHIRAVLGDPMGMTFDPPVEAPPLKLMQDAIYLGDKRFTPLDFARAVGKPDERVFIHPGRVILNGQRLMECCIAEDAQYDMTPRVVPPGAYFVLGDNRNDSADSHIWGMLSQDRVIGRADVVFWPISHAKRLE